MEAEAERPERKREGRGPHLRRGRGPKRRHAARSPAAAREDQRRRPRSHAAVMPAARPSSGQKASAGPAIFSPSPPPAQAQRAAAAAPVLSERPRPPLLGSECLPCTYLVSSATFLTKRDVLGGRRYRDMTAAWVSAGTLTGSANRPQLRRRNLETHSRRTPLRQPPLLARVHSRLPPHLLPECNAGTCNGSFPRDHAACACACGRREYVLQLRSHSLAS